MSQTNPANHNNFYQVFGQLLSRIYSIPSKNYQKRRKMAIAVPQKFLRLMHKKIHKVKNNQRNGMKGGWTLFGQITNLRIWSVDMKLETIKEYHWKSLLKEKIN